MHIEYQHNITDNNFFHQIITSLKHSFDISSQVIYATTITLVKYADIVYLFKLVYCFPKLFNCEQ